jgi:phosphate starvation-inducible PhoH-like protein
MKMFLTRMGAGSKIVASGDTTQIDLPEHARSGLVDALERLHGIDGIGCTKLGRGDIVRHALVQKIVNAYEHHPHKRPQSQPAALQENPPASPSGDH